MSSLVARSLLRSSTTTALRSSSTILGRRIVNNNNNNPPLFSESSRRSLFSLSPSSPSSSYLKPASSHLRPPFGMTIGSTRYFSEDHLGHYPDIKDDEIKNVFKDFQAADWGELPDALIDQALKVLSKPTGDEEGKEVLKNVFRSAEAVEEFIGTLETLKMALDDSAGLSGENVKPLSQDLTDALAAAYERYVKYLDSFGPDEVYLKKKVETELGRRMIHVKMRCSGLGSEWGKVTVLGTSGISGSYIEQRGS